MRRFAIAILVMMAGACSNENPEAAKLQYEAAERRRVEAETTATKHEDANLEEARKVRAEKDAADTRARETLLAKLAKMKGAHIPTIEEPWGVYDGRVSCPGAKTSSFRSENYLSVTCVWLCVDTMKGAAYLSLSLKGVGGWKLTSRHRSQCIGRKKIDLPAAIEKWFASVQTEAEDDE